MTDFLASGNGLILAWVLLAMGAADIVIGWLWLGRGRKRQDLAEQAPQLYHWLPAVFLVDVLMVAVGAYGLRLHGVW